jgi:1-aminocyclopropane-1-carboxylate deaminase/D-cysteine desulfhydrase-like pyridoxal-dependent ACC family enzyme
VARSEGILLDPVYTSKAMAALFDHVREGRLPVNRPVLFLHTGGAPALFGYAREVLEGL